MIFDVVGLFTNIPIKYALLTLERNNLDEDTLAVTKICPETSYFLFDGSFYIQTTGIAMGSPISPIIANVFMEEFERVALHSSTLQPKWWDRYVDDTFVNWPHGEDSLKAFHEHINSINPHIHFTIENENNSTLPFLDVEIHRNSAFPLCSIYRKPTHTNKYLEASSHHPTCHKTSVLSTLMNRALNICDTPFIQEEISLMNDALSLNGYTKRFITKTWDSVIEKVNNKTHNSSLLNNKNATETLEPTTICIPYIKGTSEKIAKVRRKEGFNISFYPINQISSHFASPKDHIPNKKKGVYKISCSCGKIYIGETGRCLKDRIREHKNDLNTMARKFPLVEHLLKEDRPHSWDLENSILFAKVDNFGNRRIREALEIILHPNNVNRDHGLFLHSSWAPLIQKLNPNIKITKWQS